MAMVTLNLEMRRFCSTWEDLRPSVLGLQRIVADPVASSAHDPFRMRAPLSGNV